MKRTVKNGDIIFDGIHNRTELEKMAFERLEEIENVLKNYNIKDVKELDKILQIQKFLNEHEYCTLPRDEFDLLFEKLKALDIIKNKCEFGKTVPLSGYETFYDIIVSGLTQEEYDLLRRYCYDTNMVDSSNNIFNSN